MRNVFDQYSQPENRLTHALACTLDADRALLRPFLRWCGIRKPPPASGLHITEQQVPGEAASGDEGEGRGLPIRAARSSNDMNLAGGLRPGVVEAAPVDPPQIMTIDELAAYLQVAKLTLYKLAQEGKVPGRKVGEALATPQGRHQSMARGHASSREER